MALTLFHRTTVAEARAIVKEGFEDQEWDFGLRDVRTGEDVTVTGVWLADRPLGPDEGLEGDAVLEVQLSVEHDELRPFELEGMFWDARVWVAPADWVTQHSKVRFLSVDPSASGFFDAANGEPDLPDSW